MIKSNNKTVIVKAENIYEGDWLRYAECCEHFDGQIICNIDCLTSTFIQQLNPKS